MYLFGLVCLQYCSNLFPFCSTFSIGFLVDNFFLLVLCRSRPITFRHLLFLMRGQPLNFLEFPCAIWVIFSCCLQDFLFGVEFSIFTNVSMDLSAFILIHFFWASCKYSLIFLSFFLNQNFSHYSSYIFFLLSLLSFWYPASVFWFTYGVLRVFKALSIFF